MVMPMATKTFLTAFFLLLAASLVLVPDADARRFGAGRSLGKQYSATPRQGPGMAPRAPEGAPVQSPSGGASRWLGPLAGLAAGGLVASLLFGDAFQGLQIMDILVLAALIFGGIALFRAMRRSTASQPAGAAAYAGPTLGRTANDADFSAAGEAAPAGPTNLPDAPAWFNRSTFADGAKSHFIRLQAAWDRGDFGEIREYVTPELLADLQRERQLLGPGAQHTEVVTLDAEVLEVRREGDQVVASVLFSGLIREEDGGTGSRLREIWHVQHAWDTSAGDWYIAGVQQVED
jgi:predicted lipid-binding transport protein (Tim44 family)